MTTSVQLDNQTLELIKGTFDVAEAREVLMTMLVNKIKFHERRSWGSRERLGMADRASEQRAKELRSNKEKLEQLLAEAETMGVKLTIQSEVTIAPVDS